MREDGRLWYSNLGALNDGGTIKGLEVREGDGVYITYQDGADSVSKKLGEEIESESPVSYTAIVLDQRYDMSQSHCGSVGIDCSKAVIYAYGLSNNNGYLTVYDANGKSLGGTIAYSGTYTINASGIRSWKVSYNFPSGYASVRGGFNVTLYK